MVSDVIRINKELKEEIKKLQIKIAKQTGKWVSQAKILEKLLKNGLEK